MKFNFNKTANFDEENLDNIWVVDMWLDNMDSKDGHDHIEFTKIGLIDFLNNEIKDYNSTNGADYTVLNRNATNKEVKEVLYDLLEGKVVEIKPYNEKTASKGKYYIVDLDTGKELEGPFNTKEQAQKIIKEHYSMEEMGIDSNIDILSEEDFTPTTTASKEVKAEKNMFELAQNIIHDAVLINKAKSMDSRTEWDGTFAILTLNPEKTDVIDIKYVPQSSLPSYTPNDNEYGLVRTRDTGFDETDYQLQPLEMIIKQRKSDSFAKEVKSEEVADEQLEESWNKYYPLYRQDIEAEKMTEENYPIDDEVAQNLKTSLSMYLRELKRYKKAIPIMKYHTNAKMKRVVEDGHSKGLSEDEITKQVDDIAEEYYKKEEKIKPTIDSCSEDYLKSFVFNIIKNKTAKKQIKAEKEPKTKIDVLFKLEKPEGIDGLDVVAWFLSDPDTCYSHNGQHSNCYPNYMASLEDAKFTDYEYLLKELENIGYEVNVMNGDYKQQKKASRKFTFNKASKEDSGLILDKEYANFNYSVGEDGTMYIYAPDGRTINEISDCEDKNTKELEDLMLEVLDNSSFSRFDKKNVSKKSSRKFTFNKKEAGEEIDKVNLDFMKDTEDTSYALKLLRDGIVTRESRHFDQLVENILNDGEGSAAPLTLLLLGILDENDRYYHNAVKQCLPHPTYAADLLERGIITKDSEYYIDAVNSAIRYEDIAKRLVEKGIIDEKYVQHDAERRKEQLRSALSESILTLRENGKPFYDLRLVWQNKNEPIQHLKQALDEAASRLDKIGLKEDADYYRGLLKQASKKVKADWEDDEFDYAYYINKFEKIIYPIVKQTSLPIKVGQSGKTIFVQISNKEIADKNKKQEFEQIINQILEQIRQYKPHFITFGISGDTTGIGITSAEDNAGIGFYNEKSFKASKKSASIKRKAGTSNFYTQDDYPLIAIGDDNVWPKESFVEWYNEENPDNKIDTWEQEDVEYYQLLPDLYDDFTIEMEHYLKNADIPEGWNITLKPGYYEGVQLWVEEPNDFEYYFEQGWLDDKELGYDELTPEQKAELQNAMQAQYEKEKAQVAQIMIDAAKACGWLQLKVDWRASNGETGYSVVKSGLSESGVEKLKQVSEVVETKNNIAILKSKMTGNYILFDYNTNDFLDDELYSDLASAESALEDYTEEIGNDILSDLADDLVLDIKDVNAVKEKLATVSKDNSDYGKIEEEQIADIARETGVNNTDVKTIALELGYMVK